MADGVTRKFSKKHPTLTDASRFTQAKLKALYLGADSSAAAALELTNRKTQALYSKLSSMGQQISPDRLKSDPDLEKLKLAAIEAYTQAIQAIGTPAGSWIICCAMTPAKYYEVSVSVLTT